MNPLYIFRCIALETGSVAIADSVYTYCIEKNINFSSESDLLSRFYIASNVDQYWELADYIIDHLNYCNQRAIYDNDMDEDLGENFNFDAIRAFLDDNKIEYLETSQDIIVDLASINNN